MKLIGSKTEQEFREQLIKSNFSLYNDEDMRRLLDVLQRHFLAFKTKFLLIPILLLKLNWNVTTKKQNLWLN